MQSTAEFNKLFSLLPAPVQEYTLSNFETDDCIVEFVLDVGRPPQIRYILEDQSYDFITLDNYIVRSEDIDNVFNAPGVSPLHENNRMGVSGTLHRISCIKDLEQKAIGMTLRIGRLIEGTTDIIADLIASGQSILFVGRPGKGKTSKLREACRILADEQRKRVIIVDSSNEIAGENIVPHTSVGSSRRMMVPKKSEQVRIMVEAVENHMPEVIVVDELSLHAEAQAARTIAERGVQLLATAHGDTLDNILNNSPLSVLVGGSKSTTLSDDEARRRGSAKLVREREHPPVFSIVVELIDFNTVGIHLDVTAAVDASLRGLIVKPEIRRMIFSEDQEPRIEVISKAVIEKPSVITTEKEKTSAYTRKKFKRF